MYLYLFFQLCISLSLSPTPICSIWPFLISLHVSLHFSMSFCVSLPLLSTLYFPQPLSHPICSILPFLISLHLSLHFSMFLCISACFFNCANLFFPQPLSRHPPSLHFFPFLSISLYISLPLLPSLHLFFCLASLSSPLSPPPVQGVAIVRST